MTSKQRVEHMRVLMMHNDASIPNDISIRTAYNSTPLLVTNSITASCRNQCTANIRAVEPRHERAVTSSPDACMGGHDNMHEVSDIHVKACDMHVLLNGDKLV